MDQNYISEELFHFVGHASPEDDARNYETLKNVLGGKCISAPPHDGTWGELSYSTDWTGDLASEKLIVPNVTCYADIPYESLATHVSKYGKFGLSLPASLLTKYGARPVTYIPMRRDDHSSPFGRSLLKDIEAIVKGFHEQVIEKSAFSKTISHSLGEKPDNQDDALKLVQRMIMKDFLAFIKPYDSELPHDDYDNYYLEREWRKYGNMKFSDRDICKVILAKGYRSQFETDFPEYKDRIYEIDTEKVLSK